MMVCINDVLGREREEGGGRRRASRMMALCVGVDIGQSTCGWRNPTRPSAVDVLEAVHYTVWEKIGREAVKGSKKKERGAGEQVDTKHVCDSVWDPVCVRGVKREKG